MRPKMRAATLAAGALCVALSASACAGAGGGNSAGDPNSINVLMVNNPQMEDLQRLTADNFTKETGIKVNYTILPENDVRAKISQEFSSQAGQYDVASLSNYEIPFYSANGWLAPLDKVAQDPAFDQDDILPAYTASLTGTDGKLYGEPFYGESSFLMYRKDILESKGLTMPEKPTWDEVADIAAKVDGAAPGMKGICLRGQPGWGQVFAPLTTVVNTFGGTWFDKDWNAQVNSPEFTAAVEFYTKLVREHGEAGAAQAGFTECLNNMSQSKVAMWYDATSAAGALEAEDSPVKGKIGYAQAPVKETKSSGWLWTWSWAMQAASKKQDAAEKFIAWASSERLRGTGGLQARLGEGSLRQAHLHLRERRIPEGGAVLRGRTLRHRERRPEEPRRAGTSRRRHPVCRHPRVRRTGHQRLPGRQLRHRRPGHRGRRAGQGPGSRPKNRQ